MHTKRPLTLLLVALSAQLRAAVEKSLSATEDRYVFHEAGTQHDALTWLRHDRCDTLLVNCTEQETGVNSILEALPPCSMVLLIDDQPKHAVQQAIQRGARSYRVDANDTGQLPHIIGQAAQCCHLLTRKESKACFRQMADNAPVLLVLSTAEGKCDFLNYEWLVFRGRTFAEEQGVGWLEGLHGDDRSTFVQVLHDACQKAEPYEMDLRMQHHDGSYRWILAQGKPRFASDDMFLGHVGAWIDITPRRQGEEALKRHDAVLEAIGYAAEKFLVADCWKQCIDDVLRQLGEADRVSRVYLFVNPSADGGELSASQRYEWTAPGVEPPRNRSHRQNLAWDRGGLSSWKPVFCSGQVLQTPTSKLSDTENQLLGTDNIQSILLVPIFVGEQWWGLLGFDECKQERVWSEAEVGAMRTAAAIIGAAIERSRIQQQLTQARDELEDRVEQRTALLKATNFELRQEIGQRAIVEEALRWREHQYHILVDTIPHGICELDTGGNITFANAAFHRMHDYPIGALAGKTIWDLLAPDGRSQRLHEVFGQHLPRQRQPHPLFLQHRTNSGTIIQVRLDWDYKCDESGQVAGFVAVTTDITERRRAEEQARRRLDQLAHVERTHTMGQMVTGVAHELNQPLAAIANHAQACRHNLRGILDASHIDVLDSIDQIADQANRAGQIVRHLRTFVRRVASQPSKVEVNALVEEACLLLEVVARMHEVHIERDLARDLPLVHVDRIQIEQVIVNLVYNAIEAMEDVAAETRNVTIRTAPVDDHTVTVAVEDVGKGLPNGTIGRLFEPFFSTKQDGIGLGLPISRSIIEAHGGELTASSNAPRGTTFCFSLPAYVEGDEP